MLAIIAIFVFLVIIFRWRYFNIDGISRWALIAVFILKVGAGYLSYKYHHIYFAGGDGNIYLNSGRDLIDYSNKNPVTYFKLFTNQNRNEPGWKEIYDRIIYWDAVGGTELIDDNRFAIRINSLVSLVSFRSVAVHLIVLIFLSYIGLLALYKTFRKWFKHIYPPAVFLAVFLSPSIVFWTSGILKETHTIFFLGVFMLQLSIFLATKSLKSFLWTIIFSIFILMSRTYLAFALFLPVIYLLASLAFKTRSVLKPLALTVVFTVLVFLTLHLNGISIYHFLADKQAAFNMIGKNADSFFYLPAIQQPADIFRHFARSLVNVYLQPQLFSFNTWLFIFPVIENIDILTLLIFALFYYKTPDKEALKYLLFVVLIWIIGGWIIGLTVPVQGAIARYKSIFIPFLLISIFEIADWKRIKEKYFTGD